MEHFPRLFPIKLLVNSTTTIITLGKQMAGQDAKSQTITPLRKFQMPFATFTF